MTNKIMLSLIDMPHSVLELIVKRLDAKALEQLGNVNRFFSGLIDAKMDIFALLQQAFLPVYCHAQSIKDAYDYEICEWIFLNKRDFIRLRKTLRFKNKNETGVLADYIAREISSQSLDYYTWYQSEILLSTSDHVFKQIPWTHQQISMGLKKVRNTRAFRIHYRILISWTPSFIMHFSDEETNFCKTVLENIESYIAQSDQSRRHVLRVELNRDSFGLD